MLNFRSLYSGSTGNSLFVESESTKILVDSGVSLKKLTSALSSNDIDISDIDAVIVTHEHSDHVQSLGMLSAKYNIPVYANMKTWDAMPKQRERIDNVNQKLFKSYEKFEIGNLTIDPFSIPHDAADPCGFNIINNNDKISIATDIGHMTNFIINKLDGSSFILLEANYDPEILKSGKYPYYLKTRILGPNGHLPNEMAGKTIAYLSKGSLQEVMLGHLSKENNFPELAYQTVIGELINKNFDENSISISVANRNEPSKLVTVS